MSEDVKLEVIRTTQDSLSKFIKKPPLTEKLLRKPPFRYLHDITTAIMRETGFLQGLFSPEELNPENIKDREAKIAFLEKLIAAVNLSTGVSITARPNKIVAGLDVTKTNELLQTIGRALEKKVDSSEAVEVVLSKKVKEVNDSKKDINKSKTNKDYKATDSKTREPRTSDVLKKKNKEKIRPTEKPDSQKVKPKKDVSPTKVVKAPVLEESSIKKRKERNNPQKLHDVPSESVLDDNQNDTVPKQDLKLSTEEKLEPMRILEKIRNKEDKVVFDKDKTMPSQMELDLNPINDYIEHTEESKVKTKTQAQSKKGVKSKFDMRKEDTNQYSSGKEEELHGIDLGETVKQLSDLKKDIETHLDLEKNNNLIPEEEMKRPQSARAIHRKPQTRKPETEVFSDSQSSIQNNKDELLLMETDLTKPIEALEDNKHAPIQSGKETKRPRTAARPASARPGAPRVRERGVTLLPNNDDKTIISEPVNLIVDTKDLSDGEDQTLVTVEASQTETIIEQVLDSNPFMIGDQGHLVSQILETQKELEESTPLTSESLQKVDISWASGKQRQQESVLKEVERLQCAIQALTRAANPLGKLIDFLQEDIDSMQSELEMWTVRNQQLAKELQTEERYTEESVEPLARQLEDISQLVEEQLDEMSLVKAAILRNDERITKLLKANSSDIG